MTRHFLLVSTVALAGADDGSVDEAKDMDTAGSHYKLVLARETVRPTGYTEPSKGDKVVAIRHRDESVGPILRQDESCLHFHSHESNFAYSDNPIVDTLGLGKCRHQELACIALLDCLFSDCDCNSSVH